MSNVDVKKYALTIIFADSFSSEYSHEEGLKMT
jgi:hypothetical protein